MIPTPCTTLTLNEQSIEVSSTGQVGACLLSLAQHTVLYGWLFDEISGKDKQCCDKKAGDVSG